MYIKIHNVPSYQISFGSHKRNTNGRKPLKRLRCRWEVKVKSKAIPVTGRGGP
jgi:hypothetical protein